MFFERLTALFHYLLPKQLLTIFAGYLANIKNPRIKNYLIRYFIRKYHIDLSEAREEDPTRYADFNAFFIRHLKPECRPVAKADVVSPVDGFVSEIGHINKGTLLQAKGRYYALHELLAAEPELCTPFEQGLFATLYLSPNDYHRIHMPLEGRLKKMIYVPGALFSVQPATTRAIPKLFARNERLVVFFETAVGLMAMVLVGATIVGAIGTSWHGDVVRAKKTRHFVYSESMDVATVLAQAEEMGYFKLGSTVILLFANSQQVTWLPEWKNGARIRLGEALATFE